VGSPSVRFHAFAASFEPIDDERRGVASGRDLAVPEREQLGRSLKVDLFDLELSARRNGSGSWTAVTLPRAPPSLVARAFQGRA
jgi:hypothetical protein